MKSCALTDRRAAFTLIEVMVAVAVLALILVLLAQILNGITGPIRIQSQRMDSAAAARKVLDVMAADFASLASGPAAGVMLAMDETSPEFLSMVTQRRSPDIPPSGRYLGVVYAMEPSFRMVRRYAPIYHTEANFLKAATMADKESPFPLAEGILGVRFIANTQQGPVEMDPALTSGDVPDWLLEEVGGLSVPSGWRTVVGLSHSPSGKPVPRIYSLQIWIASADPKVLQILTEAQSVAVSGVINGQSPSAWRNAIDALNIPGPVKSSIQILNRTYTIP